MAKCTKCKKYVANKNLRHYNNSNKYHDTHINDSYNQHRFIKQPNKMMHDVDIRKQYKKDKKYKKSIFYVLLVMLFAQFITIFALISKNSSQNDFLEKFLLLKGGGLLS